MVLSPVISQPTVVSQQQAEIPFVTIVMPALNEERYIAAAIDSITQETDDSARTFDYELIVMDGGSTDATHQIVAQLAAENSRIRLVNNPKRLQSAAVNLAAVTADTRSRHIIRADCHATYPAGFVANLIATLNDTGAQSVVVSMRAVGSTCIQTAIAAAQNSRLGNGGSAHRLAGFKGFVDHGHHAAFDRAQFIASGGYDEACAFNEDAEFDRRLSNDGGKIYLSGDLVIDYFPRDSFTRLARQYANHGWGRANTLLRHGTRPRLRQMLPVAVFAACLIGSVLALIAHPLFWLVPAGYLLTTLILGIGLGAAAHTRCAMASGLAAITMHMSWAVGFLRRYISEMATGTHRPHQAIKLHPLDTPDSPHRSV